MDYDNTPQRLTDAATADAGQDGGNTLRFTVVWTEGSRRLSKRFGIAGDGSVETDSTTNLSTGRYDVAPIDAGDPAVALGTFGQIIEQLPFDAAIVLGVPKNGHTEGAITVDELYVKGAEDPISRTLEHFDWPDGLGLLLFDGDDIDGLFEILCELDPAFAEVAMVVRPSASASVIDPKTGERLKAAEHAYCLIDEPGRSKEVLEAVIRLAWCKGTDKTAGRLMIGKDGHVHVRGPVDVAVGSPERLSYEGAAVVEDGLSTLPRNAEMVGGNGILNVARFIAYADLHAPVERYNELIEVAKNQPKFVVERAAIATKYAIEHGEKAVKKTGKPLEQVMKEFEEANSKAVRTVGNRTYRTLPRDHTLFGKKGRTFTIDDIIKDPETYHHTECADPIEGLDYMTRNCGYIECSRTKIIIYSQAHGGRYAYESEFSDNRDELAAQLRELHATTGVPIPTTQTNWRAGSAEPGSVAQPRPPKGASMAERKQWLLANYGYCALNDVVVELFKPSHHCHFKQKAFETQYWAWRKNLNKDDPKKLPRYIYSTEQWKADENRYDIEGSRMRPDMPFPTYVEKGRRFKNTYRRPTHVGDGDIKPWLELMAHLLPIEAERAWFLKWLAHKWRFPGIPGVSVIMVAAGPNGPVYGTGRGMLGDIIAKLLGRSYVKPIDFDIFAGKSDQSDFTDWSAYAVLVIVSEAKDTLESGRWSDKRATYEQIKEIADPRAVWRTFTVKSGQQFEAPAFACYLIFSNNRDALQIPDDDRRAAAFANGEKMSPEMAKRMQAWMDDPGNIAALARFLEARDLDDFDIYTPPVTKTKTTMQALARSALDDAFASVRELLGPTALFTGPQIHQAVETELGNGSSKEAEERRRWIAKRIRVEATQVNREQNFRMTPERGRDWILCWRDFDASLVVDAAAARGAVDATSAVISKAYKEHATGTAAWIIAATEAEKARLEAAASDAASDGSSTPASDK